MKQSQKTVNNIISALDARTHLEQIKNIAPTPEAYQAIRDEAKRKGTNLLTISEIDREIAAVRRARRVPSTKQIAG